jgi:nitrate/nitrite transporter NarK
MIVIGIGLVLGALTQAVTPLAVAMFCIAAIGMYGYPPAFWAMPPALLSGTAAAASIGMINAIGNLGGFVGPYLMGYLTKTTHSFSAGVIFLASAAFVAACIVISLPVRRRVRTMQTAADTAD